MKTKQKVLKVAEFGPSAFGGFEDLKPQLGFLFGPAALFEKLAAGEPKPDLGAGTVWIGCSTAGEISNRGVTDQTAVMTAIRFENAASKFRVARARIDAAESSENAGREIARQLDAPDLRAILVISPGLGVNGSFLVKGIVDVTKDRAVVSGGLAGDGGKFEKTYTLSSGQADAHQAIGVGFYGDSVELQHGCMGGWDPFGKQRSVTKSTDNVVYELDGKPALEVYKEYLGDHVKGLPASGLMFPWSIQDASRPGRGIIRTILSVDADQGSVTFAGDVPQGSVVKLMHANTQGLVTGAKAAAAAVSSGGSGDSLALLVSCVGRKLVMGANVDEEVEAIQEAFGERCALTGFYSYGEISPFIGEKKSLLHNQTMTITHIAEK